MRTPRSTTSGNWLRPYGESGQRPRTRLVCMPHAGGTAQAYSSWAEALSVDVSVFAVQYPGRQDRFLEAPADDMSGLVEPIVAAMRPFVGEPLVIFGHSMGAFVAYEVTVELERRHGPVVDLLVVSGAPPPHQKAPGQLHKLSDADLIAEIERVNPSFAKFLTTPELVEVLLPTIRADYRLTETYERRHPVPVKAALLAAGGSSDPEVGRDGLRAWSAFAADRFEVIMFPGDHFYLVDDEAALIGSLAARLSDHPTATRP